MMPTVNLIGNPYTIILANNDTKAACRGVGHIKGAKYTTHHTSFGCPYTVQNINRTTSPVVDRLAVDSNVVAAEGAQKNTLGESAIEGNTIYPKRFFEFLTIRAL